MHKRFWKAQVPYLSRHFRVVSYDGPGNGRSDRPHDATAYDFDVQVRHALAVLDATGTERAVVIGLSQGGAWALQLAAEHGARVLGAILISSSLAITDGHPMRLAEGDPAELPVSRVPFIERDPVEHWAKDDPAYWKAHYEDFLWFFFGMCFPEPHSTKQIEDCVGWGLETTPDVLTAEAGGARPGRDDRGGVVQCRHLSGAGDPRQQRHDQPAFARTTARRADRWRVRRVGGRWPHPARTRTGARSTS